MISETTLLFSNFLLFIQIYAMGSLYTSVIPSLIAQGVGETIRMSSKPKILLLNGSPDRETGQEEAYLVSWHFR
jgi:2-phospho-L-lactate transferase/gluconeogenesis factor (CofD/UPF0052 family)